MKNDNRNGHLSQSLVTVLGNFHASIFVTLSRSLMRNPMHESQACVGERTGANFYPVSRYNQMSDNTRTPREDILRSQQISLYNKKATG